MMSLPRTTTIRCKTKTYQKMKDLLIRKEGQLTKGDISEFVTNCLEKQIDAVEAELNKRSEE